MKKLSNPCVWLILLAPIVLTGCTTTAVVTGASATASVVHDRRSTGTVVEDQEILLRAMQLRNADEKLKADSNISIRVYNMRVLLTGQAKADGVSAGFADQVSRIPRVRRVFNEVVSAAESTWTEDARDKYLESRVKIELFNVDIDGFDPTRVKVTASQGDVFVMGLVTQQEAQAAIDKIRFVSGVKRVINLFEYVNT